MIYLDNAATTWPKPPCVEKAMRRALAEYGANPGRGGHAMSLATAQMVYRCREQAAAFFGLGRPERVVFCANTTAALNLALKSLAAEGGRIVISDMEHNSVTRPLESVKNRVDVAPVGRTPKETLRHFERCVRPDTVAVACLHASNVFGTVLPIAQIGHMARRRGLIFAVDAAQTAGVLPISMEKMDIDLLCVPGHKGLYGPPGTGLLLCGERYTPRPLMQGGSGVESLSPHPPAALPERLECGTLNTVGICGLSAAFEWLLAGDTAARYHTEWQKTAYLYRRLSAVPGIRLYTPPPRLFWQAPLLSVNLRGMSSETLAAALDAEGVAVRAGLHCSPAAHRHMGTLPDGTVRLAPSVWTSPADIERVVQILYKISKK